jgi:hypothetical protein
MGIYIGQLGLDILNFTQRPNRDAGRAHLLTYQKQLVITRFLELLWITEKAVCPSDHGRHPVRVKVLELEVVVGFGREILLFEVHIDHQVGVLLLSVGLL